MARESCNLDKDEAEIFKPSSSSSPSASPSSPPSSSSSSSPPPPPSSMLLKSCEESVIQRSERSSSSSPPPPPPSMLLKPCEESAIQKSERPESPAPAPEITIVVSFTSKPGEETQARVRFSNRCSTCRKKVGLTGFRCRCGDLFCGRHRYSDAHECSFDYKAAGREEIAKANPVIKAAKIIKI